MENLIPGLSAISLAERRKPGSVIFGALACGLLLTLGGLSGCLQKEIEPDTPEVVYTSEPYASMSIDAQIAYNHLVLNESLEKGDLETALVKAEELIRLAPAPELFIQAAVLQERAGQSERANMVIREGAQRYPDDFTIHMVWAELLEQQGKIDQALAMLNNYLLRYEKIPAKERQQSFDEISSIRQYKLYLLLNARRFADAESFIKSIPAQERTATIMFYEVVLLRNQGKSELANTKLYDLVKKHPGFTDGWLTLAADMEKAGNYGSAARFYNKALESNPVTEIYLRMLAAQIRAGDVRGAQNQVIAAPFSSEVKTQAAILFMDSKEYRAARAILLTLQNDPYASDDAAMYLGMIAYETGEQVEEALERLKDVDPEAENRARILYLTALLHIKADDYPAALESAQALRDEYPESKDNWAFLAELAIVSKHYDLGETICREALELWPDDISLMYSLAMSLSLQKKNDEAVQIFEDILLLDETNVMAMNALAYTLAEENRDLERALLMVRKALSRDPENGSILDTLAWVYYQMGNYPEAWVTINLCIKDGGTQDPIIWDHYGDIALALEKPNEARVGYLKALELSADNSQEIRQKLRNIK